MTVVSSLKALSPKSKPVIDIVLNNGRDKYVSSYTTLEKIEGEVTITVSNTAKIDDVEITFEGITKTWVESTAMAAPSTTRSRAQHNFLKLRQPIEETALPPQHVAQAGQVYKYPFTFVVPEQLLPQTCNHKAISPQVRDMHLHLPPSFGDPMLANDGVSFLDDMAPEMSRISYLIRVRAVKMPGDGQRPVIVSEAAKKVRIIPAYEEQPPLHIEENDEEYCLHKEKDIKKGIFKGKLGRLVVECRQPKSLHLPAPGACNDLPITTSTTVNLCFYPADHTAKPPRLSNLFSKLRSRTFFATQPMSNIPAKSNSLYYDTTRGLYDESVHLPCRGLESTQWQHHQPTAANSSVYYTARIVVPITLPRTKTFVPSFYSCLVARTYKVELTVSYHSPSAVASSASMTLSLPLQISSAGNQKLPLSPLLSYQDVVAMNARDSDVDEFFIPRSIAPPQSPARDTVLPSPPSTPTLSARQSMVSDDAMSVSSEGSLPPPPIATVGIEPPVYAFEGGERLAGLGGWVLSMQAPVCR